MKVKRFLDYVVMVILAIIPLSIMVPEAMHAWLAMDELDRETIRMAFRGAGLGLVLMMPLIWRYANQDLIQRPRQSDDRPEVV